MESKEMTEYDIFQDMITSTLLSGNEMDQACETQNQQIVEDNVDLGTLVSNNEILSNINILLNESVSNTSLDGSPFSDCQSANITSRGDPCFDNHGILHSKPQGNKSLENFTGNSNHVDETVIENNPSIAQRNLNKDSNVHSLHKRNRKLILDEMLKVIIEGCDKPEMLQQMITVLNEDILNSFTLISLIQWLLKKHQPSTNGEDLSAEETRHNTEDKPSVACPTNSVSFSQIGKKSEQLSQHVRSTYTDKLEIEAASQTDENISFQLSRSDDTLTDYGAEQFWNDICTTPDTIDWQDTMIAKESISNSFSQLQQGSAVDAESAKTLKIFLCTENNCGQKFKAKQSLNLHQLKHHNIGTLFSCEECEYKTPRRKDFHGHLVSQHQKLMPGLRVYVCKFCEYKCVDKLRLDEHEASHTGLKKYSCVDCGKFYTTKRGLRTHIKFHSNKRPFKCGLCEADFKVKSKLTDHLRLVHLKKGEKPFQCGYCQHRASIRGNVNQHIRKIHKDKPIIVLVSEEKKPRQSKNYNYSRLDGSRVKKATNMCSVTVSKV